MGLSLKELMQEDVRAAAFPQAEATDRLMAAIDFSELLVWWTNRLTGKLKTGGVKLTGISIQPSKQGDGFCITIRGLHERTEIVGFHFCGQVLNGLYSARKRIEDGSIGWKADSPLVAVKPVSDADEGASAFSPDRLSFG